MDDTIFALSSGRPPAGIAVIRVSGERAHAEAEAIAGPLPPPRTISLRSFVDPDSGELIDRGILIVAAAPATATGENMVEFQCHGGKATIAAMLSLLSRREGLRAAEAGEFTRRALINGRIDLSEAEGLADLLSAETELQRRVALRRSEGAVRTAVNRVREQLLALAAQVELAIDYVDEEEGIAATVPSAAFASLLTAIDELLSAAPVERLREGVRVVVAGPPNAGKSSLVNMLAREERAIVTEIPGTTRDLIEVPLSIEGIPIVLVDTAGLRESGDQVETIGIDRARDAAASADILLWLGGAADCPSNATLIATKSDLGGPARPGIAVSSVTGDGCAELWSHIRRQAALLVPAPSDIALSERERNGLREARALVCQAIEVPQIEIAADRLRAAREHLDAVSGNAGVEEMLDALFSRFCVGK